VLDKELHFRPFHLHLLSTCIDC